MAQASEATAPPAERTSRRKTRQGVVVSNKLNKTLVVNVERTLTHPLYKKVIRRSKKYHVHDEENVGQVGDLVRIMETRPLSRTKRWRLVEVLRHA